MIVADTGAILALIDRDDRHHALLLDLFDADPTRWLLPWAILPEVDYLVAKYLGSHTEQAFVSDLSKGLYRVDWGADSDLDRADELIRQYTDLNLGLVDAVVMAVAERTVADAVATLDERHFGVVVLHHTPRLLPRDL